MVGKMTPQTRSDTGATSVEYGIMVALIALAVVAAVVALGGSLDREYDCAGDLIQATPAADPATVAC